MLALVVNSKGQSDEKRWVHTSFDRRQSDDDLLIPEINDAYGVAFKDITNDGRPDLYVVRFRDLNRLFMNRGPGKTFRDRTIRSGLGGNLSPRGRKNLELGAAAADFDNDGNQDILIAGWDRTTHLFRGDGGLQFTNITATAGIELPVSANGGIWADIDLDGDLDLFLTNEHGENHLYRQSAPGKFINQARALGVDAEQISQGASFGDLDGDGYPDLYVCNWFAPDLLYRNLGGERFERIRLSLPHLVEPLRSNGVWPGDYDNDGDVDLLVTDRQRSTRLYRNDSTAGDNWLFTDVTAISGLINPFPAYSGVLADFNNDGWQDVYFTNIGPNQLFLNRGGGKFELVHQQKISAGSRRQHYSTGAAVADYDRDGDLDLFVSNKDTSSILFTNQLADNPSLRIRPVGSGSNRDAVGAQIRLFRLMPDEGLPRLAGYREISGGQGYLSTGETVAHFGVDPAGSYRAEIRFPSGKLVVLNQLSPGQKVTVYESETLVRYYHNSYKALVRLLSRRDFPGNFLLIILLAAAIGGYVIIATRRYNWTNRQSAGFITATIFFLFIWFGLIPEYGLRTVLFGQLVLLLLELTAVTGFSERIRQLQEKRYGYRPLLRRFSRQLILIHDNRELFHNLTDTIYRTLRPEFCALMEPAGQRMVVASHAGSLTAEALEFEIVNDWHRQITDRSVWDEGAISTVTTWQQNDVRLAVPIRSEADLLGFLVLGRPAIGEYFQSEDRDLLVILAGQAALAIANNRFIEETKTLTEQVTAAQTREKYVSELEQKNAELEKLYTDLKATQAQLIQSEKMSSLGQLVAGVAHELNNPIGFIYANMIQLRSYTTALKSSDKQAELPSSEDIDQIVAESIEGSRRVRDIVENLRNFSRLDEAEFKSADIHQGLDSTLMLLNNELKNRITVHKNYGTIEPFPCLPGYLNQVFMNLLINAAQAIDGQGNIWITTRATQDKAVISIRDDGRGIPESIQAKIFDPFFTSKDVGEGTGLGLSISYGIIERHGGGLEVKSVGGEGSEFIITLPLARSLNEQ